MAVQRQPIAWAPPPAEAPKPPQQLISERKSADRKSADDTSARDQPRRSSSDVTKPSAKPEQADARGRAEKERSQGKPNGRVADDAKHAQRAGLRDEAGRPRDSPRGEPGSRHSSRASDQSTAEAKHAQRDSHRGHVSERGQRAAHSSRDAASPRDSQRLRAAGDSKAQATPATKLSTSR